MDCWLRRFLSQAGLVNWLRRESLACTPRWIHDVLEGQSKKLPILGSAIWVYNSLQIVFTLDGKVDIIRLCFDDRRESRFASDVNMLARCCSPILALCNRKSTGRSSMK